MVRNRVRGEILVWGVLVVFFIQNIAFSAPHLLQVDGQRWGQLSQNDDLIDKDLYVLDTPQGRKIYQVKPIINADQKTELVIIDLETLKAHTFPIEADKIIASKNYLFVTVQPGGKERGFYVIRLIDLFHLGFNGPVPLFQIPIHESFGTVTDIVVHHGDDLQEERIVLESEHPTVGMAELPFSDIEDMIKAQLVSYTMEHALTNPQFKQFEARLISFQSDLKDFYRDLYQVLSEAVETHVLPDLPDL